MCAYVQYVRICTSVCTGMLNELCKRASLHVYTCINCVVTRMLSISVVNYTLCVYPRVFHTRPLTVFHFVHKYMRIAYTCTVHRYCICTQNGAQFIFRSLLPTGTLAKTVQQEFSFLPYLVFHKVLVTYPSSTERGHSLRLSAFAAGVVHHTLFCLSVSGHHNPRVAEKDVTTREFAVVSALETRCVTQVCMCTHTHTHTHTHTIYPRTHIWVPI